MNVTFSIPPAELAKLNAEMLRFAVGVGKDLEEVTKQEGRLLLRDVINYTPPRVRGNNDFQTVAPRVQRKAAEERITREIESAFLPFVDMITRFSPTKSRGGTTNYSRVRGYLKDYANAGRVRAIQTILAAFHLKTEVQSKATLEAYKARKTKAWIIVLDESSIGSLTKRLIKHAFSKIGKGKSGWNKSAWGLGMGGKVPKWVSDKYGKGTFSEDKGGNGYSVTMTNAEPHIQKNPDEIVGKAIRRRIKSMQTRLAQTIGKRASRKTAY